MQSKSVIIIGAGAAGLMAARILAKAGKQVIVLEARNRCGGRIHTLNNEQFFKHAELGAEFVHGDLPITLQLLNEANISYHPAGNEVWRFKDGKFIDNDQTNPYWGELMEKLNGLEKDCTIHEFLQNEFYDDKYIGLRTEVEGFASGYDSADPKKASAFALRAEWEHEGDDPQYRISGGYAVMINYLIEAAKAYGAEFHLNTTASKIIHNPREVIVEITDGRQFKAAQVLIALPLGVLHDNDVKFYPPVPKHTAALNQIGFGATIKVIFEFTSPFWEDEYSSKLAGKSMKQMGFILSDELIPTWWTQEPSADPVLTGWLGGLAAFEKKDFKNDKLLEMSLQSVATIFGREVSWLKDNLVAYSIQNWTNEPYTKGSYAYDMIGSKDARQLLSTPIDKIIYFAGEYLYEGTAMGTVEAALTSGKNAAAAILSA